MLVQGGVPICSVCKLPLYSIEASTNAIKSANDLDLSVTHQLCLPHSYPPSHLDRNRYGLKHLSSYGWDPDSRVGLGASGEGINAPVKVKVKNDTVGLGMVVPKRHSKAQKVEKLDPSKIRKKVKEDQRKREITGAILRQ